MYLYILSILLKLMLGWGEYSHAFIDRAASGDSNDLLLK